MRLMLIAIVLLGGLSLSLGSQTLQWADVLAGSADTWLTLGASRLPRLLALLLAGSGLAVCGVILQHMVRNRFVEPGTTGGLEAAKLGILVSLVLLPDAGLLPRMLLAMLCCLLAGLLLVMLLRRLPVHGQTLVPVVGLLYGVVLAALAEYYAYNHHLLQDMQGWLLGDFSRVLAGQYELLYLIVPATVLAYVYARRFTVMGMGEQMASALGLGYASTLGLGLLLVALVVAATVITVGAIPFVGLVVPNLVAMRYGENLERTLPLVASGGALLLLLCDVVGRVLMHPFEVPIALTAGGLGGLVFVYLILRGGPR